MKYVLILSTGKLMIFSVKACAELYRKSYGGTLVTTFDCEANFERLKEVAI
jgi:hypothetical protein